VTLNIRNGEELGGHRAIPHGNLALELMGERTGAYQAVFDNSIERFRQDALAEFDAICFNNSCGVLFEDKDLQQGLLDYIAGGKGFIGFHAAAATFCQHPNYDIWPAFGEMLGATENGGHPWRASETITLTPEDTAHPINAAFKGEGFEVQDEVFQFQQPYSRDVLRVLLKIDTDKTDTGPDRRILPERRADMDFAMSWIRAYGGGRVFYTSLGHNPAIFWNPMLLEHFLAGIQYALGDLQADATPSARL
jgi:type 1 glutamine amidotransferase